MPRVGLPIDHLPLPREWKYDPPVWPFHCEGEEYDGGPFLEYPARQGWSEADILDPGSSDRSDEEIGCFFQNWFFFGLLSSALREPIKVSDFVDEDESGQRVITTKNLPDMIMTWLRQDDLLPQQTQEIHAVALDQSLRCMGNILSHWVRDSLGPFDPWITSYVTMFGEYMDHAHCVKMASESLSRP